MDLEAMTKVAREADGDGRDSIRVFDHPRIVPEPVPETAFECRTITATLARDTERVRSRADGGPQRLPDALAVRQDRPGSGRG
jgi:hypothetical protein